MDALVPENLLSKKTAFIILLVEHFPHIVPQNCCNDIDREWRELPNVLAMSDITNEIVVDFQIIWKYVRNIQNSFGEMRFRNIIGFVNVEAV